MAHCIMVQGTTSNAGKSFITAGLCRVFKQDGYSVAPFKSQNMALNSYITIDGYEIGRAQAVQAEASGIEPNVYMNPILLKPTGITGSQVIVNGRVIGTMLPNEYYEMKSSLILHIENAYNKLAEEHDIIVIEGAGSPAEINIKDKDISNMLVAKMVNSPVILVGDIDRGGVYASLFGTFSLLDRQEQDLVCGTVINKFRGSHSVLQKGNDMLEGMIKRPVFGVVPFIDIDIEDEDSISERLSRQYKDNTIDIAVIRLPAISNFTDFNPLSYHDNVNVRYVTKPSEIMNPDLIIIPGTKNTISDLKWLRSSGLEAKIIQYANDNNPIIGICGGYQMLGREIIDEVNAEGGGHIFGMNLLEHSTVFKQEKITRQVMGMLDEVCGIFADISGMDFTGYEIHMGVSSGCANIVNSGNVYGTYIHGVFDNMEIIDIILRVLAERRGAILTNNAIDIRDFKEREYNKLADTIRKSLDIDSIYKIMGVR